VFAFASIGGMQNNTGEYCRALYYVILISLSLSWLTAVTTTPLMVKTFIKPKPKGPGDEEKDPYGGTFFQLYRKVLIVSIRMRWITVAVVVSMFAASLYGFGYIKQMFFPPSTRPQFMVEVQFREGIHIKETEKQVAKIEDYLKQIDGITQTASAVGAGHPRFLLTYDVPVDAANQYALVLASVEAYGIIDDIFQKVQSDLEQMFPDATINVKKFNLGPGNGGKIQLRINGADPEILRAMSEQVKDIIRSDPDSKAVRDEWGAKVKVIRPLLAEDRAERLGIDRQLTSTQLQTNFSGTLTGFYREGIELIPIYARAPAKDRQTLADMADVQIISPMTGKNVPILQIIDGVQTEAENARVSRYNRRSMIKLHADARQGLSSEVFDRVKPKIEQALGVDVTRYVGSPLKTNQEHTASTIPVSYDDIIPLKGKPGYFIAYSGEAEDSAEATHLLGQSIPVYFGLMILTCIFLFNAFRQPLIIWLTVPLAIIGVAAGLLLFNQPFGFMALLGVMSLSGMLIKNAIVLIEQIDTEIRAGKDRFDAVVDSGVSRMRPVAMAALTTILGMIPLLQDGFFVSMAVTIMFGLGFATVLTLVFVPVLYTIFFKIPSKGSAV
jgi:multidrug efflux pump subunit AcrB